MLNKSLSIFLLVCMLALVPGCVTNPITGKQELNFFATGDDVKIGDQYAPEVEKQLGGPIANQDIQNYVSSVGQKIAVIAKTPEFTYKFVAVNEKSMNAMALPGGHIFITKGMLEKLTTEAQLAAVLAHEAVHIVARHSTQQMSKQVGIDILLSAASKAGANENVMTVANLAGQLIGLKYSRDEEKEADLGGLDYLIAAGYDGMGMVQTMQIIQANSQGGSLEFLSSHPNPDNRVEYLTSAVNEKKPAEKPIINAEDYKSHVLNNLK